MSTNQQISDEGLRGMSGIGCSKQVSLRIIQGGVILKGQEVQQSFLGRACLGSHSNIYQLRAETSVRMIPMALYMYIYFELTSSHIELHSHSTK